MPNRPPDSLFVAVGALVLSVDVGEVESGLGLFGEGSPEVDCECACDCWACPRIGERGSVAPSVTVTEPLPVLAREGVRERVPAALLDSLLPVAPTDCGRKTPWPNP